MKQLICSLCLLVFLGACNSSKVGNVNKQNIASSQPPSNFYFEPLKDSVGFYLNNRLKEKQSYVISRDYIDNKRVKYKFKDSGREYLARCSDYPLYSKGNRAFVKSYMQCTVVAVNGDVINRVPVVCNAFMNAMKYDCDSDTRYIEDLIVLNKNNKNEQFLSRLYVNEAFKPVASVTKSKAQKSSFWNYYEAKQYPDIDFSRLNRVPTPVGEVTKEGALLNLLLEVSE